MSRFTVEIEEGETGLFYATSPEVKGLMAVGHTREEAEKNVPQALYELLTAERDKNAGGGR